MKTNQTLTRHELNAMYQRPEKFPFERLNALMDWAKSELGVIQNKNKTTPHKSPANTIIPHSAKTLVAVLLFAFCSFTISGCAKEKDKCESKTCSYEGTCRNGTCYCNDWYEGGDCETEQREKFTGGWTGTVTDDNTGFVANGYYIPVGNGTAINQINFVIDGGAVFTAYLTDAHTITIGNQLKAIGGTAYHIAVGSGVCVNGNLILDFSMQIGSSGYDAYHYSGYK